MPQTIFTFIVSFFVLFVAWFLPIAGTPEVNKPKKKALIIMSLLSTLPATAVYLLVS